MDDVERTLHAAWRRIRPRLDDDAHDLARRLARRRRAVLTRPPRAWCPVLPASDTRLATVRHLPSPPRDHDVVRLRAEDLRRLCAPISLPPAGEMLTVVAE